MSAVDGPVQVAEVMEVVFRLRELAERAEVNGQASMVMVLGLGAESLSDNLAVVSEDLTDDE